jgi:IS30 family transposase
MHGQAGGVYRPPRTQYSDRFLSREERYEIARLREVRPALSVREIGRRIGRDASTVSRELRRNVRVVTGRYEPEHAEVLAYRRQQQAKAKTSKLSREPALRAAVQALLDKRCSPQQAAGRLALLHPDNPRMNVSHETIYQSLYVYPRGGLRRELQAHLRSGRTVRRGRRRQETRGRIVGAVSIHDRPEEVVGRLVPGHHEGDLIMGSLASHSAVGTIVERATGYLTLVHLPDGYKADRVADAVIQQLSQLPAWFTKTLTWDRGQEMSQHARVTAATGIDIYFADPYAPYQRGSNENTNGLIREYLPKGTDLSIHGAKELAVIAAELNDRPRKRLGYYTPTEAFTTLLEQQQPGVATLP